MVEEINRPISSLKPVTPEDFKHKISSMLKKVEEFSL